MTLSIRTTTSAILVLGALAAGCGDDDDDPGPGNMDAGTMLDGMVQTNDGSMQQAGPYSGRVVNSTSLEPVAGRTVRLFNPADLSFYPGLEAVGGNINFANRPEGAGAFVLGGGDFQDTWNFPPARIGEEMLIRVGTATTATLVPGIAQYMTDQKAAPLAGTVLWRNTELNRDEPVGCVTIEGEGVNDVRFFSNTLPAPLSTRGLAQGTQPARGGTPDKPDNESEAGRFFIANIQPGARTLIAKANGMEIGRVTFQIKARDDGSPIAGGERSLLFLGSIFVGENSTINPTPPGCL